MVGLEQEKALNEENGSFDEVSKDRLEKAA